MRRVLLLLTLVSSLLPLAPARAVPPAAGGAFASGNVDLIANIPDVAAIGARVVGDTMYVTTSQGLRVYDLAVADGIPVLSGILELPHFENEDVDTNGEILLIAADSSGLAGTIGNMLYVISLKPVPVVAGVLPFPGDAHTVSCIDDCKYAWLAGASRMYVVDLNNPAAPKQIGYITVPGGTHDVQTDATGINWVVGGGGMRGFRTTADPLAPELVAFTGRRSDTNGPEFNSNFILHNSMRPNADLATPADLADDDIDDGELVLVTEEDWLAATNDLCENDGQFQTGWLREVDGRIVVERLDGFNLGGGTVSQAQKPIGAVACSSHYFDYRDDVMAVAWYEQGVRFLDVSKPDDIRQIGYYMPAVTETWSVLFHGDHVYTIDIARGIDVLKFTGQAGDVTALAPRYNTPSTLSAPSERWGYACRIPLAR
ncbi:MAG TPA: hypothetical protein VM600_00460 [Actinomycetota bacterium]|nr:hypothetical protein [Actinomycetota bacterium]